MYTCARTHTRTHTHTLKYSVMLYHFTILGLVSSTCRMDITLGILMTFSKEYEKYEITYSNFKSLTSNIMQYLVIHIPIFSTKLATLRCLCTVLGALRVQEKKGMT